MVERAKVHIRGGDIFSDRPLQLPVGHFEGSLFNTYRGAHPEPPPYMFYFFRNRWRWRGASPETLVKLENGVLHTLPSGGQPRERPEEDQAMETELPR